MLLVLALSASAPQGVAFFDQELVSTEVDGVFALGVEAHGPPERSPDVLRTFDDLMRDLASGTAVLPHKFGIVSPVDRIEADLREHHDRYADALCRVDGADEWTLSLRPRVDEVLAACTAAERGALRSLADPIERGRWVHFAIARAGRRAVDEVRRRLADAVVHTEQVDDGLGVQATLLLGRDRDAAAEVRDATAEVRRICDAELVGPGPAYRTAAVLMDHLRRLPTGVGA